MMWTFSEILHVKEMDVLNCILIVQVPMCLYPLTVSRTLIAFDINCTNFAWDWLNVGLPIAMRHNLHNSLPVSLIIICVVLILKC